MGPQDLPQLAGAELVVTGRFHGVCLAIPARRPFLALASNTHKVEGLLADAQPSPAGRLLAAPPADPAGRIAWFDQAIDELRRHLTQSDARTAHLSSCGAYQQRDRQALAELFSSPANGAAAGVAA